MLFSQLQKQTVFCWFVSYQPNSQYIYININITQYQAGFSIPTTFESQPPFNFGSCFFEDRSYGKSRGKGWGKNSYEDYSTFGFFRPVFLLLPKGHGPNGKPRCFGRKFHWHCHVMDWKWGALLHSWIAYCVSTAGILFVRIDLVMNHSRRNIYDRRYKYLRNPMKDQHLPSHLKLFAVIWVHASSTETNSLKIGLHGR